MPGGAPMVRFVNVQKSYDGRTLVVKNLNLDIPWFRDLLPSAEHIAQVAWRELRPHIPAALAFRVRLWETPRNWVDYDGR